MNKLPSLKNLVDAQLGRTVHPYLDLTKLNKLAPWARIALRHARWKFPIPDYQNLSRNFVIQGNNIPIDFAAWAAATYTKLPDFLKGSVALITQGQVKAMNAIPYNIPKLKSKNED